MSKVLSPGHETFLERESAARPPKFAPHATVQRTAPIRSGPRYTGKEKLILLIAWTGTVVMLAALFGFVYAASQLYMFH